MSNWQDEPTAPHDGDALPTGNDGGNDSGYDSGYDGGYDTHWDDSDDDNPFGGVEQPDGIVYAPETQSPELQWQPAVSIPMPPERPRPQQRVIRPSDPWKPGPDPVAEGTQPKSRLLRVLITALVPMLILAGLGILLFKIVQAYGF